MTATYSDANSPSSTNCRNTQQCPYGAERSSWPATLGDEAQSHGQEPPWVEKCKHRPGPWDGHGDGDGDRAAPSQDHHPSSAQAPSRCRDPSTNSPGEMPVPALSGCVQLAVAVEVWEVKQPRWQRCEPGARQPAEPLAGPATILALGGEISRWDGAKEKVSAPVMKAARCHGWWCSAPSTAPLSF